MSRIFFIVLSTIVFLVGQSPYIRSTLPVRDGIIYNPDSGRPFSEFATEYFDNGQVKVKGRYSGGFANGYWSYYHPNGQIKARGRYYKAIDINQNNIIENGRAGKWVYWFNNGTKQMTGIYKNGQMDGNWVFWYQNGFKHSEGKYKSGKLHGEWQAWYANGNIQETGEYIMDLMDGEWLFWDSIGQLIESGRYEYGRP